MARRRFLKQQAVIDSSCLRCLMFLDLAFPQFRLPRALQLRYEGIHIPTFVWNEVARRGRKRPQLQKLVKDHSFFRRCSVLNPHDAQLLYDLRLNPDAPIDRGEAEAIIQARELAITNILIDERRGTRIARAHSLNARGTVGLVKEFKQIGIISEARPLFEECLRQKFWIDDELLSETLKELGE